MHHFQIYKDKYNNKLLKKENHNNGSLDCSGYCDIARIAWIAWIADGLLDCRIAGLPLDC
jgi:hypothetical protein